MKKKVLCLLSVFVLSLSMTPFVYASSGDAKQTEGDAAVAEVEQEPERDGDVISKIEENSNTDKKKEIAKKELSLYWDGMPENAVLEVIKGTNLDQYGVTVNLDIDTGYSQESALLNEMVSGYDKEKLGYQDVTVTWQETSCTLKINVIEGEMPAPVEIEATLGFDGNSEYAGNRVPLGSPEETLRELLEVKFFDANGSEVNVGAEPQLEISKFDTNVKGKHKVTVKSSDFNLSTEITVRVIPMKIIIYPIDFDTTGEDIIRVPLGGATIRALEQMGVNADNPKETIGGLGAGGLFDLAEEFPGIDVSKPGVQEYTGFQEAYGMTFETSAKISIGVPEQVPQDELLSEEAKATMPSGEVVGTWDVPSGEAGAGTWVFHTGLKEGQKVTVWSYHNQKWIKIGVYTVDTNGNVTVTFKADQLSPILITKNGTSSEGLPGGDSTTGNKVERQNGNKTTTVNNAPQTGDTQKIMLFVLTCVGSLFVLGGSVVLKMKKSDK